MADMLTATDWQRFKPVFDRGEWGKDPDRADPFLVYLCFMLRMDAGVPMHPHVCWDDGGHSGDSYHYRTPALAVDFHFARSLTLPLVSQFLLLNNAPLIGGIGFYPFWTPEPGWHIDRRPRDNGARLYWVSPAKGVYQYTRNPWEIVFPAVQQADAARQAKDQTLENRLLECLRWINGESAEDTKAAILAEQWSLDMVLLIRTDEKCPAINAVQ